MKLKLLYENSVMSKIVNAIGKESRKIKDQRKKRDFIMNRSYELANSHGVDVQDIRKELRKRAENARKKRLSVPAPIEKKKDEGEQKKAQGTLFDNPPDYYKSGL